VRLFLGFDGGDCLGRGFCDLDVGFYDFEGLWNSGLWE